MNGTVGERLRVLVANKGWTLQKFAEELGVVYETVRKWLVGETAPNRRRVQRAAELLDTTPEFILYGSTPQAYGGARPITHRVEEKSPYGTPPLHKALPVVLDAIAAARERDKLRAALLAFLDDDAQAYRQRIAELLGDAASSGNSQAA